MNLNIIKYLKERKEKRQTKQDALNKWRNNTEQLRQSWYDTRLNDGDIGMYPDEFAHYRSIYVRRELKNHWWLTSIQYIGEDTIPSLVHDPDCPYCLKRQEKMIERVVRKVINEK